MIFLTTDTVPTTQTHMQNAKRKKNLIPYLQINSKSDLNANLKTMKQSMEEINCELKSDNNFLGVVLITN